MNGSGGRENLAAGPWYGCAEILPGLRRRRLCRLRLRNLRRLRLGRTRRNSRARRHGNIDYKSRLIIALPVRVSATWALTREFFCSAIVSSLYLVYTICGRKKVFGFLFGLLEQVVYRRAA
jgi:hypothetical protein